MPLYFMNVAKKHPEGKDILYAEILSQYTRVLIHIYIYCVGQPGLWIPCSPAEHHSTDPKCGISAGKSDCQRSPGGGGYE